MTHTLFIWILLFGALTFLAVIRPVWGLLLYLQAFFAFPPLWWWGHHLAPYRISLIAGIIFLASALLALDPLNLIRFKPFQRCLVLAGLALLNATFVHFSLAPIRLISLEPYTLMAKFTLLLLMMSIAIRNHKDLRLVLLAIVVGLAYIGYEVAINDSGGIVAGRLEGVGCPGARTSNDLAHLFVSTLPLVGVIFFTGQAWQRVIAVLSAPFILNVVLLCNSRGALLAAVAGVFVLLIIAPRSCRRRVLVTVALGGVLAWLLMGDPRIVQRFMTIFASAEKRDYSAASRLQFWKAGLRQIQDYPLGSGGNGFKDVRGADYLAKEAVFESRAVHQGYINEACEWGVQGLALRLLLLGAAMAATWKYMRRANAMNDADGAFIGACLITSMTVFLIASLFGDRLDSEWGYWLAAFCLAYARLVHNQYDEPDEEEDDLEDEHTEMEDDGIVDADHWETDRAIMGRITDQT